MSFSHEYTEETVQCPYDKHHIILKSRFINHLCKCRKLHRGTNFSTCPFNATHNIPTPELQYHVKNCPDRRNLESHLYVVGERTESAEPVSLEVPASENWDEDSAPVQSYLDVKDDKISSQKLLRLPRGKSKAQRKEFFVNETQRFQKLSRGETAESTTSNPVQQPTQSKADPVFSGWGRGTKVETSPDFSKTEHKESPPRSAAHDSDDDDDNDKSEKSIAIVLKNKGRGRPFPSTSTQE